MTDQRKPGVIFVRPGDLHLENREAENARTAAWMVDEVNQLVQPDFVQFAGDNVQNAKYEEFDQFTALAGRLNCRWEAMVGDHDIVGDTRAELFRRFLGATYKSFSLNGITFIRLNSLEALPVGFSDEQLDWFERELTRAQTQHQRVIVFQHHYPFKVCEQFAGPGIDRWRALTSRFNIEAILTGHTHYGQIANDGRNISIATRSIGDPEGGPPGYHVFYIDQTQFAATYRSNIERGPIVLVTSPRAFILSRDAKEIVSGPFQVELLTWCATDVNLSVKVSGPSTKSIDVVMSVFDLPRPENLLLRRWGGFADQSLPKGFYNLKIEATAQDGHRTIVEHRFWNDPTGRFTAVPQVDPWVDETEYC